MKGMRHIVLLMMMAMSAIICHAKNLDGIALAQALLKARQSEGFEARFQVEVHDSTGLRHGPLKLALIGQFGESRGHLMLRVISPAALNQQAWAAKIDESDAITAVRFNIADIQTVESMDPNAALLDTDLVLADLLAPWLNWQKQTAVGLSRVAGHDCHELRSKSDTQDAVISEVISCIDPDLGVAYKTTLFDHEHRRVRSIQIEQTMAGSGGRLLAKRVRITGPDRHETNLVLYGGDEQYIVRPESFSPLRQSGRGQGTKP